MRIHELKTMPPFFQDILDGVKKFEIRFNDRNYKLQDYLVLREYDGAVYDDEGEEIVKGHYTGKSLIVHVTYVCDYKQKAGYVVMGIEKLEAIVMIKVHNEYLDRKKGTQL